MYAFSTPHPLRYVPDGIVGDASPGWYTPMLLPDLSFSVVITPTPHTQAFAQQHGADALFIQLEVNGAIAHPPGRIMDVSKPHEYIVHGFTLANHVNRGSIERTIKRFLFPRKALDIVVRVRAAKYKLQLRESNEAFHDPCKVDTLLKVHAQTCAQI